MRRNLLFRTILILVILGLALWVDLSKTIRLSNPFTLETFYERNVEPVLGLDLRGGLQVVLESDLPNGQIPDSAQMEIARTILENRTNALGVSENVLQRAGDNRIVGEFPGLADTESVINTIQQTGLLEFVQLGTNWMPEGTIVQTDYGLAAPVDSTATAEPTATATLEPTAAPAETTGTPEAAPTAESTPAPEEVVYHTVMTGTALDSAAVVAGDLNEYTIYFTLTEEGSQIFSEFTSNHVGEYLAIVLDKAIISAPVIQSAITEGEGQIQGGFTYDSANALVIQLRYGSLPIPLKIVESRVVGPTLGEDSLQRSLVAGVIGMIIVMLFMAIYYRLPGIVADFSILFYALIAFALFKLIPVTLTLPGIAGFLLSTGAALDANILIFERMKEELRNGRNLLQAVDQGWTRAWSSIRDSNIATIITSIILWWFGNTFGASIVKGFSLTLALGVFVSLFTAIFVTRTLLIQVLNAAKPTNLKRWFGI